MIALLALLGCTGAGTEAAAPAPPPAPAAPEEIAETEALIGLVVALVDEEVTARAPGQLAAFEVGLGDEVVSGQPLARLSDPGLAHTLARARARTSSATSAERGAAVRADAAAEEAASLQGLGEVIARKDQEQALAVARERAEEANARRAGAAEARAELALLEEQSLSLVVSARSSGRVAALYKRLGENVNAGEPVFRVVSAAQIVRFAAPADVPLSQGQPVQVHTRDGGSMTVTVARIAPSVDSAGMILAETSELLEPMRSGDVCRVRLIPR